MARRQIAAVAKSTAGRGRTQWSIVERVTAAFGSPSGDVREHRLRPLADVVSVATAEAERNMSPPLVMPAPGSRLATPINFKKELAAREALSPPHKRSSGCPGVAQKNVTAARP